MTATIDPADVYYLLRAVLEGERQSLVLSSQSLGKHSRFSVKGKSNRNGKSHNRPYSHYGTVVRY